MVKPIYCNLLLIFSCLIYEAYGSHPYNDSLSSSTTVNDGGENTATPKSAAQSLSPRPLKKPFSSNNALGYDKNPGSVQDNKSSNYFGPYGLPSSSTTVNDAGKNTAAPKSAAQSPSPRPLKKPFSSNNALGNDKNPGSVQDNKSSNYFGPYGLPSSSTTVNDAGKNTATPKSAAQSPSPRPLKKPFSSNNALGYDKNPGSVQDNKSSNYFGPYGLPSSSTTVNDAGENTATPKSAAQSPSPRPLKKPFSSNNALGYDKNPGSVQDNKSSNYFGPYGLPSSSTTVNDAGENTATPKSAAQSPSPRPLKKPFSSNNALGYDKNPGSVQDNKSSNYFGPYGLPSSSTTVNDAGENTATPKSAAQSPSPRPLKKPFSSTDGLGHDRNRRSVQDNKSQRSMNRRMPSHSRVIPNNMHTYNDSLSSSTTENGAGENTAALKSEAKSPSTPPLRNNLRKSKRNRKQPMIVTSSNGDNDFIMPNLMDGKLKPFRLSSFNKFGDNFNEDSNTQETENPKNMRLGSMGYLTIFPSFGSSNDIGMPGMGSEKLKPNYPYSKPIGVSENKANEIRNKVLQKSNFYRKKFELKPFILDDQLNNCAQDWANNMAKQQSFDHRPDNVYGENLYGNQDLKNLGIRAVDSWYNEMAMFTIGNEENFDTFHMTQLLWKKSTKLGVGVSQDPGNDMFYVVANYDPKGNLLGHFKENLPEITEGDIEKAKKADKRLKAKLAKPVVTSWSSGSSIPFGSGWRNDGPYFK